MKKATRAAACAMAAMTLSGCFSVQMTMRSMDSESVYMTRLQGANEGHYQESETIGFLFWGLVPLGQADPSKFLRKYVGNGRRIASFRASTEQSPIDWLLTGITLGIYSPLTMRYEWDVVYVKLARKGGGTASTNTNTNSNTNTIIINPGAGGASVTSGSVVAPASGAGGASGMVVNPVISSLTASPPSIRAGHRLAVSAEAYSAAGRPLAYNWSSTGGVLSATTGRLVFWTAPDQAGNYAILVSITDGAGGQAVGSVNVTVTP